MSRWGHILAVWVFVGILTGVAWGADTMLMFVGEDLEVLSIASRREEAAWSAPAIAGVVKRTDMQERGATTLAEALEGTPGFYMNRTEKGFVPYLRGIQNSALFMYDTVPMNSGIRKSDVSIGYETSLASVKRLEVVRGAGSVLWGPDAFAGMVNVVPLTGKDFQGIETGLLADSHDFPGEIYMNWGAKGEGWNSFLSVSGRKVADNEDPFNVVRFWNGGVSYPDRPEPIGTRYGYGEAEDSRYLHLYGNISFGEFLTLSARIDDNRQADTVENWSGDYAWQEKEKGQARVFKVEASKSFGLNTGVRFTGFYSQSILDQTIVDYTYDQEESSVYGEIILDQSLWRAKGLATLGISMRRNEYDNVPVWQSYVPDYFTQYNLLVLPVMWQGSFDNRLSSVFGQYRHDFSPLEFWMGARYDDHDQYNHAVSYNFGLAWNFGNFIVKGLFGTAFRTPFPQQLQSDETGELEKIKNTSVQVAWKAQETKVSMTMFRNSIRGHVIEDRYQGAGLSTPNEQTIYGVELEAEHRLTDDLSVSGNLTLLGNSGPNETYLYKDYVEEDDDGNLVNYYNALDYAYESGPDIMGTVRAVWQLSDDIRLVPELRYFSSQSYYSPVEDITQTCDSAWIAGLNLIVTRYSPLDISVHVSNLLDNEYLSPGVYSVTEAPGLSAGFMVRMRW